MADENSISLKEHLHLLMEVKDKSVAMAFEASKQAVDKAEENAEKWRLNANEWRAAMNDRERNFMPRNEVEAKIKSQGVMAMWSVVIGFIGLLTGIGALLLMFIRK